MKNIEEIAAKWIRQASGIFKEEYLEQCHEKMLQDAVKTSSNTLDVP